METLWHVTFVCPSYTDARSNPTLADIFKEECSDIFLLHRNRWNWKELRAIISFFEEVAVTRQSLAGAGGRRAAGKLQARVNACWDAIVTVLP